ncbi:recombinase family protein [Paraburkholderia heleia]|uniref:recombinase family protein n=1 Tax=Paraburkholderia heleia TaxID=634127 RepID=UPI002AB5E063|nr:recombinase family protein [Paraburkholderia heleia]
MRIGYARVSTEEQSLDLQLSALKAAGCDLIFSDYGISGTKFDRPGLHEALHTAQSGDALVVWRLDRLGRSLRHLLQAVSDLGVRHVEFVSLTESIDTRSPTGMLMFHMIAALAEFERSLISERTRAGMTAARARGAKIGRPRKARPDMFDALDTCQMLLTQEKELDRRDAAEPLVTLHCGKTLEGGAI